MNAPVAPAGNTSLSEAPPITPEGDTGSQAVAASLGKRASQEVEKEVFSLAERLLLRLPPDGAVIAVGDLSGGAPRTASEHVDSSAPHRRSGFLLACARLGLRFGPPAVSTASEGPVLAGQLALGLQIISSKPVLLIDLSRSAGRWKQDPPRTEKSGLAEVLRGSATLEQSLRPTSRPMVKILSYGDEDETAPERVISQPFRDLLHNARGQFPWIVLHCSSLLGQEESVSIISRADALLVTLKRGVGHARDVRFLRELCSQLRTDFLGVVLT